MRPTPRKFDPARSTAPSTPPSNPPAPSRAKPQERAPQPPFEIDEDADVAASDRKPEITVRFVDHDASLSSSRAFRGFDGRLRVICLTASLAMFLIPVRATTVGWNWSSLLAPIETLPWVLITSVYDVLFALLLGAAALLLVWLFRMRPLAQRMICIGFAAAAVVVLAAGVCNVVVVRTLGAPVQLRWLHYSSFFRNNDGHNVIRAAFDFETALTGLFGIAAMLLTALAMRWIGEWRLARRNARPASIAFAVLPAVAVYLLFAHWYLTNQQWPGRLLSNPAVAFGRSMIDSIGAPRFFSMSTSVSPDDVTSVSDRSGASSATSAPRAPDVRNVIFFVMESVPAEMVEYYGGGGPVNLMPNLQRYRDRAIVFRDIYAPGPTAHAAAVSLFCSAYPWMNSQPLPAAEPALAIDSIAEQLRAASRYRTACFASADLNTRGLHAFIASHGFEFVQDCRTRKVAGTDQPGTVVFSSRQAPSVYGSDDVSTANSLIEWIDQSRQQRDAQPFFATVWTLGTQHPYFAPASSMVDYHVNNETYNRYLNAMRHGDEALGTILAALESRKLLDSTLLVVVSDRGEPFGKHSKAGSHGRLYDEDLRVPLIMINPRLFHGEQRQLVGSLVDVAPTVFDLLGIDALPGNWQGRSLFLADRADRAYFFSGTSDVRFGCRDGSRKLIYDAIANHVEVYDLKSDPTELRNLATDQREFVHSTYDRIAAWAQYQHQFYDRVLSYAATQQPGATTTQTSEQSVSADR